MAYRLNQENAELVGKVAIVHKALVARQESPDFLYAQIIYFFKRNTILMVLLGLSIVLFIYFFMKAITTLIDLFS